MIVPFGQYSQGEIVRGAVAEDMAEKGFAVEIKMADPAPEVKAVKPAKTKAKKE